MLRQQPLASLAAEGRTDNVVKYVLQPDHGHDTAFVILCANFLRHLPSQARGDNRALSDLLRKTGVLDSTGFFRRLLPTVITLGADQYNWYAGTGLFDLFIPVVINTLQRGRAVDGKAQCNDVSMLVCKNSVLLVVSESVPKAQGYRDAIDGQVAPFLDV